MPLFIGWALRRFTTNNNKKNYNIIYHTADFNSLTTKKIPHLEIKTRGDLKLCSTFYWEDRKHLINQFSCNRAMVLLLTVQWINIVRSVQTDGLCRSFYVVTRARKLKISTRIQRYLNQKGHRHAFWMRRPFTYTIVLSERTLTCYIDGSWYIRKLRYVTTWTNSIGLWIVVFFVGMNSSTACPKNK